MPTNQDAQYTLILKFSEVYFQEPGQKVFDIKLGNTPVIRNLDIFDKLTSRGIPYDEFIDIQIKGGKVFANGAEAKDALKSGKLIIDFIQGPADNPKVNAIVLVEGGKENTHFQAHKTYLKTLQDLKEQQMKQQMDQNVAQEQRIVFFDYFADDEDPTLEKTAFNAFLSKPYILEAACFGFLAMFFTIVNGIGK